MAKQYPWMIYGATGRCGELIARKAVAQGLRPILAARDTKAVQRIAEELNLSWRAFELGDWLKVRLEVSKVNLLVNAAGPLMQTSVLIAEACLAAKTHYFDLSNQVPSLVGIYMLDAQAKDRNLTLLPGLAFSPAASNCLVKHLQSLLPDADTVDIALKPFMRTQSKGANLTLSESLAASGFRRRGGVLERYSHGTGLKEARLPTGRGTMAPAASADAEAAYRCTNIPNIAAYVVSDLPLAFTRTPGNRTKSIPRPDTANGINGDGNGHDHGKESLVWARLSKVGKNFLEGWLQLGEGRDITAAMVVAGVARLLKEQRLCIGAHTAATALGADFILDLPNVKLMVQSLEWKM